MAHDHHDEGGYYVEQLCTIGVCGALGGVAVVLWYRDYLEPDRYLYFLHPSFRLPLFIGGIALLVLTFLRAAVVWRASGRRQAHAHAHDHHHDHDHHHGHEHHHEHGEACDHHHHEHGPGCEHHHDHAHESASGTTVGQVALHDHDHGHDHGWGPWRYALLLLPIMLFFLGLPPAEGVRAQDSGNEVSFKELLGAADNPERRAVYQGRMVELKAQLIPGADDRRFMLKRFRITCCGADAIPLDILVLIEPEDPKSQETIDTRAKLMKWVRVTGQIQFRSRQFGGREEWALFLVVRPTEKTPLRELVIELPANERPSAFEYSAVLPQLSQPDEAVAVATEA